MKKSFPAHADTIDATRTAQESLHFYGSGWLRNWINKFKYKLCNLVSLAWRLMQETTRRSLILCQHNEKRANATKPCKRINNEEPHKKPLHMFQGPSPDPRLMRRNCLLSRRRPLRKQLHNWVKHKQYTINIQQNRIKNKHSHHTCLQSEGQWLGTSCSCHIVMPAANDSWYRLVRASASAASLSVPESKLTSCLTLLQALVKVLAFSQPL